MAALILPHRWRQQPQVPVSIDWGNPLAKDLIGAMNPGAGIDHVSGSEIVWQGAKINAQASGPGVYLNGATNSVPYVPVNFDLNTPMTLLSVTSVTSVSTSKSLFGFTNTGSVNPLCSMSANISTGVITSLYRSSTGSIKSQLTTQCTRSLVVPNLGDAVVAVMTHSSGATGCRAFVDGVLDGTNSAVNATASTPVNRMVMNGSIRTTTVGNTGAMYLGLAWRRALSDAEVAAISENPWQIFRPIRRRIWVPLGAAPGDLIASLAFTEADDIASASASASLQASSNITETVDTLSSTAAASLLAAATVLEQNDAIASALTAQLAASLTSTEGADTLSASTTLAIAALLLATEAPDTLAATAAIAAAGGASLDVTEAPDSAAATVAAALQAALTRTEGQDVLNASGVAAIVASLARSESADTLNASAQAMLATALDALETADVFEALAQAGLSADAIVAELADTLTATITTGGGGGGPIDYDTVYLEVMARLLRAGERLVTWQDGNLIIRPH